MANRDSFLRSGELSTTMKHTAAIYGRFDASIRIHRLWRLGGEYPPVRSNGLAPGHRSLTSTTRWVLPSNPFRVAKLLPKIA